MNHSTIAFIVFYLLFAAMLLIWALRELRWAKDKQQRLTVIRMYLQTLVNEIERDRT
jgi:hypothetical protein